jgi:hypothetical protein
MDRTRGGESTVTRTGDRGSSMRLIGLEGQIGELLRRRRSGPDWPGPVAGSVLSRRTVSLGSLGLVENQVPAPQQYEVSPGDSAEIPVVEVDVQQQPDSSPDGAPETVTSTDRL